MLERRTWIVVLAVLCLVGGVLPFLPVLGWLPWGADATKWVGWASLDSDTLWQSVAWRKHFVGYRPVAAFSYVVNHATTGHAPWGYRLFDLVLHGLSGALVALLVRQWAHEREGRLDGPTAVLAAVVVLILFGHPATEEVVPYSARRSYLLAMCFGTSGLLLFGEALRWTGLRSAAGFAGVALLLGLAVLSNESAYVLVPLLPLVGIHLAWSEGRWWRIALGVLPTVGVTLLAVGLRLAVLGSLSGGYHRRYFAIVDARGRPAWRELDTWQPWRILYAAGSYLVDPHETSGARLVQVPAVHMAIAVAAAAFFLAMLLFALRRRRSPVPRSLFLAAAWLVGSTAIIVLSQTWFWRQAYFLLPPYGLFLGVALREAFVRWPRDRRRALGFGAPAGLLALLALVHGPVLRLGMNARAQRDKVEGSRVTLSLRDAVAELDEPTDVLLVVPLRSNRAQLSRLWMRHFFSDEDHRFHVLAHLDRGVPAGHRRLRLARDADALVLSGGYWLVDAKPPSAGADPPRPGSRPVLRVDLGRLRVPRRPVAIIGVDPSPLRIDLTPKGVSPQVEQLR